MKGTAGIALIALAAVLGGLLQPRTAAARSTVEPSPVDNRYVPSVTPPVDVHAEMSAAFAQLPPAYGATQKIYSQPVAKQAVSVGNAPSDMTESIVWWAMEGLYN